MAKQTCTILTIFFLFFFTQSGSSQIDLKINQWKSYLPYQDAASVTQSDSKIYYATKFSLLIIDKEDDSVELLSKVNGLSEAGMGIIKYDRFNQTLIATYFNGNLDLIKEDGSIVNLPFIFSSDIIGDKEIIDIYIDSEERAYFAMGFGLKILNVKEEEFGDETRAGIPFKSITVHDGFIYAATEMGIYRISQTGVNIQDFGLWERMETPQGFPDEYTSNAIATYQNQLYVNIDDALFRWDNGTLSNIYQQENHKIDFLTTEGEHLLIGAFCRDENTGKECNGEVFFYDGNSIVGQDGQDCVNRPVYAIEDAAGRVFYTDKWRQYRIADKFGDPCNKFAINSPFSFRIGDLVLDDDNLYVGTETGIFSSDGLLSLVDGEWSVNNDQTNSELDGNRAFYRLAVHPENKKIYIGTRWDGLVEYDPVEDKFTTFTEGDNSTLDNSDDPLRVKVEGLAFDSENNLWLSNYTAENQKVLSVLKADGTFTNDLKNLPRKDVQQMIIDQNDLIWISTLESGIYVYDYAGTIDNKMDDRIQPISTSNSNLPNNRVKSLAIDLDGNVWAGTTEGAIVFECPSPFDGNCLGTLPKVDVNGILGLLLETEIINTIAVDGANRKWFGTQNGIFVQSPNGVDQIAKFNTENSPLFDNTITDIAINNKTGEVFIGTGKGLISLRTDATEGGNFHNKSEIYAFPNPVRPDYEGPIAIKGFARDSNIKITDLNGQLVFETQALGGQAIWNGRDYNGRKASSGVYLVLGTRTSNVESPEAVVTKILLMN